MVATFFFDVVGLPGIATNMMTWHGVIMLFTVRPSRQESALSKGLCCFGTIGEAITVRAVAHILRLTSHGNSQRRRIPTDRHPCKSSVKEKHGCSGALGRARIFRMQNRSARILPLGGGSCLRRTRHPFTVSGQRPSQKIECVFSASPETVRREPREFNLRCSVGQWRDLAVCALCDPGAFPFVGLVFQAASRLPSSAGTKSRCARSTARRYATILRATASVARLAFPFCFSLS